MATSAPRIFVSHSQADNDFGLRLVADLRRDLGSEDAVWYDDGRGLYGGAYAWRQDRNELTAREVVLVVLSPDAVASPWVVQAEIYLAWQQKNSPAGKIIIPILYRECEVPLDLRTLPMITFVAPKVYDTAYGELLTRLGVVVPPVPQQVSPIPPDYPLYPATQYPYPSYPYIPPAPTKQRAPLIIGFWALIALMLVILFVLRQM